MASVEEPCEEDHAWETGAGYSHNGEARGDSEEESEAGDGEEKELVPGLFGFGAAIAVHDAEEDEVDERDRCVDEGNADPAEEAGLVTEVVEGRAPGLRGECGVVAEGEDDDPLDPFGEAEGVHVVAVDGKEGEESGGAEEEGFAPRIFGFVVLGLCEEVDEEAEGDGGSLALGEACDDAAENADEGDSPVLRSVEEEEHRGEGEENAEPVMGCIESAEQDEAEGERGG